MTMGLARRLRRSRPGARGGRAASLCPRRRSARDGRGRRRGSALRAALRLDV